MWQILAIVFMIAFVVCLIKAWIYWISGCALLKYIDDKQYTHPSDAEMDTCVKWAIMKALHITK